MRSRADAPVMSSLLFALMHGNLPQSVCAFAIGLLLGYVCDRFALRRAKLLHMANKLLP